MTPERRLHALLNDPKVESVHLSRTLRRRVGISKKAAEKHRRLHVHAGVPGAVLIAVRQGRRDNVDLLAYDEEGEAFVRAFAQRPAWHRLGL
ncbi:MAG: hypothetical protein WD336_02565 [Trueperaceae bacterium]